MNAGSPAKLPRLAPVGTVPIFDLSKPLPTLKPENRASVSESAPLPENRLFLATNLFEVVA